LIGDWISSPEWQALALSARVAVWCTLIGLPIAVTLGWLLARKSFAGKKLVEALLPLPMVLPPVVPGYILLLLFGRYGWLGAPLYHYFGVSLAFHWSGAVLASLVVGFPLLIQPVRLSFQLIDPRLEQAARTLGAGPLKVFLTITLPLASPGILAGAVLAFSRSLGEFGATITFVGNVAGETRTLPLAIYSAIQQPGGEAMAMHLIVISIAASTIALFLSQFLSRKLQTGLGYQDHA